jgi:hypothetical protein
MSALKRFNMKMYIPNFIGILYQSTRIKKGLFCVCQGLQSFNCNREEIRNLLICYITNIIASISVYSNYLPTPVKVVWVILSSYYRRTFVEDDNSYGKNQEASL